VSVSNQLREVCGVCKHEVVVKCKTPGGLCIVARVCVNVWSCVASWVCVCVCVTRGVGCVCVWHNISYVPLCLVNVYIKLYSPIWALYDTV
jgi:hypothetical protein